MSKNKTILVAPIHWGLGHASRSIPIINKLLDQNFQVIIASDGAALLLLQKEFPDLETIKLPSYNIRYPRKGWFFKWKMIASLPSFHKTMKAEKEAIERIIDEKQIDGIISDGRFGVYSSRVPSVYITHQLNVITGTTTLLSRRMHQKLIENFDICWVPDYSPSTKNFSGRLSHSEGNLPFPIRYIGTLSRFTKRKLPVDIDILVLLSGPEPQRTRLEKKLLNELKESDKNILIVQGIVSEEQQWKEIGSIKVVNYMGSEELEETLNRSDIIVSRSGYSTIMDLVALEKKAFFIPTPGQYEQEYLANRLKRHGVVPATTQDKFKLEHLDQCQLFDGLKPVTNETIDWENLFSLFYSKGKLRANA